MGSKMLLRRAAQYIANDVMPHLNPCGHCGDRH